MARMKIKKNDQVLVITGKDKGKKGRVIEVLGKEGKVIVEGINIVAFKVVSSNDLLRWMRRM